MALNISDPICYRRYDDRSPRNSSESESLHQQNNGNLGRLCTSVTYFPLSLSLQRMQSEHRNATYRLSLSMNAGPTPSL